MISYEERDKPDMTTAFPVLDMAKQGPRLGHNSRAVMAQVGWLRHSGSGYAPICSQIGVWEYLGDGKYGIKD